MDLSTILWVALVLLILFIVFLSVVVIVVGGFIIAFLTKLGIWSAISAFALFLARHMLTEAMLQGVRKGFTKVRDFFRNRKKPPSIR